MRRTAANKITITDGERDSEPGCLSQVGGHQVGGAVFALVGGALLAEETPAGKEGPAQTGITEPVR